MDGRVGMLGVPSADPLSHPPGTLGVHTARTRSRRPPTDGRTHGPTPPMSDENQNERENPDPEEPNDDSRTSDQEEPNDDSRIPDDSQPEDSQPKESQRDDRDQPEILICPAQKGPWGVVTQTSGPQEPPAGRHPDLIRADALLRVGMVALDKFRPRRLEDAERHFRKALVLLERVLTAPHPRISYALDRIGLACHLQGRLDEAEALYLRSLAILGHDDPPTKWNELTLINLAVLYGTQGRHWEQKQVMRRLGEGE